MTLKTSSRSISPFWRMFAFTLRKNLGIVILLCVASLMFCPGGFLSVIESAENSYNTIHNDRTGDFAAVIVLFGGLAVVVFNIVNFTFLYKRNAGDVFHSFPLTRCQLLLSRALAGFASTLIPIFLSYISFSILIAFYPWIGDFTLLALFFLNTIMSVLVCSSFSLIFIVCAGSMFDLGVSLAGVNLAILFIANIFDDILNITLKGYGSNSIYPILYNLSIPYFCYSGFNDVYGAYSYKRTDFFDFEFYIRSILYIIGFSAVAVLLYNYRKAEKGGTAYAYKFMYLICSVFLGICGGYITGIIFGYSVRDLEYWFFMTLGAVITSTVYGAISNRGFKQIWRSVAMGGVAAAVSVVVALIGFTGGFGYTNRIPSSEDIGMVTVGINSEIIEFNNPQKALALHNDILNNDAAGRYGEYMERVSFCYTLKNGKEINRRFNVDATMVSETMLSVYTDTTRIDKYINQIEDKPNSLSIGISWYGKDITLKADERVDFLKAYKKDLKSSDVSIFTNEQNYEFYISVYSKDEKDENVVYDNLKMFDSYSNTLQYMKDVGSLY